MRGTFRAACAMMAAGVLAACGDSTGSGGLAADEGLATFDYSGAVEGRFSARGGANLTQPPTVAYAEALARPGFVGIQAGSPRADGRFDNLILVGSVDFAVGTFPMCLSSGPTVPCMEFRVFINSDDSPQLNPGEYVFVWPVSGSVRIDRVTASRVRGTFTGTVSSLQSDDMISITNGEFDLPIRAFPE